MNFILDPIDSRGNKGRVIDDEFVRRLGGPFSFSEFARTYNKIKWPWRWRLRWFIRRMWFRLSILATCLFVVAGCDQVHDPSYYERIRNAERLQSVKTATRYGDGEILTVIHDKHWFVVANQYRATAILHHPDCPCVKSKL
jgi:hypothetical protein